jgi:hypothetical protein
MRRQRRNTGYASVCTWAVNTPRGQAIQIHRRGGGHVPHVSFFQANVTPAAQAKRPHSL